ncbi:uncharacterized protein LOC101852657 isoform X3 [Aplysia californica]|uniref:Uncharacterized protein LOC101852657 isoform X3 n=1 Tax=Aplysia californica TaxID=6500 RepID=A0ABM1W2J4_APLCA|nr:uncharacterized protein LOC101852657 isoform X3 [Aplysia californica]
MPVRRQQPVFVPRASYAYKPSRHDYGIDDSINRVEYFSNAVLEDNYDAAAKSRGRDYELLRNANAAIRPSSRSPSRSGETRTGRQSKRFRSLPPVEVRSPSPPRAVVPYRKQEKLLRSNLPLAPSPNSLLSSRINTYLRGSSMPPAAPLSGNTRASSISYKSFLKDPPTASGSNDMRSTVSYRSYLSDPSVLSPLSTRSSSKVYRGYVPSSLTYSQKYPSSYRTRYDDDDDNDYVDDDGEEYEPGSYRRKYKILRGPAALTYSKHGAEDEDEEDEPYYETASEYGTYSSPRPSGVSALKLSSYDAPYDGSYDADMAEMYDYVPFGPSRQGILELTSDDTPSIRPLPSLTTPSVTHRSSPYPEDPLPSVSLVPSYTKNLDDSLTKPSYADNSMIDSIVSSTAARAKAVMAESNLPSYKNASLVLSVEGSAVSPDGKNRYGFRYYPPPIPLKGSTIGLDERILGITPKPTTPADSFLGKYLDRLRDVRSDIRDHVDKGDYRPASRSSSVVPSRSPSSYVHRTIHMPLNIAGRENSVPVSSYRSRLDDGQSHRVDVYPLVVSETSVPAGRSFHLPVYQARGSGRGGGGDTPNRLTVLEKINIKAAIIGSRMEAGDGAKKVKRPRSQFAADKLREFKIQDIEEGVYYRPANASGSLRASRPPLYRVESRLSPDDLIYQPSSYIRLREQVRDVQEKMDRQRQLLDRYLDTDNMSTSTYRKSEGGSSVKIPAYYAAGGDPDNRPVSDLRRKLRRTIAKAKNNPDYYRE